MPDNQMNTLTLHIEYLLLKHDCIIVPGLGALINVRQPASYDEDRHVWLPMTREVRFNAAINHDDGLLAGSYARKEQVTYADGREMMCEAVNKILATLRTRGKVTMGSIGTFSMQEGKLVFSPCHSAREMSDILGYMPAKVCSAVGSTEDDMETAAEKAENSRFDTERNYYIAINKTFARVAACLAIIMVATLALVVPQNRQTNVDKASVVSVERILKSREPEQKEASVQKITKPVVNKVEAQPVAGAGRYHAIVATFATEAEAEAYISGHTGKSELRVVNGRTKSRVSAFSTDDHQEAINKISEKSFKEKYGAAWIWDAE